MKTRYLFVVLAVVAILLSSCGGPAPEPTKPPVVAPTAAPTEAPPPPATEVPAPPTEAPTLAPTEVPTEAPTAVPTAVMKSAADVEATCSADTYGCAKIEPGQTIKLGIGGPMTGGYADFGQDISQGEMMGVSDKGRLDTWQFELVVEDTQASAEGGAAVANKFVTDPSIVAIAGHVFSGESSAAMPIYEKAGLPMLSPSATNPDLTTKGSKVFNRGTFTDNVQANLSSGQLFIKLNIRKLAVLHDGTDYGKGLATLVSEEFTKLGGEVVAFEAITPKEADYSAVLSALAAKNPEALYFGGYSAEAVILINQMKQTGLENAIFFGNDGTYGELVLTRTGANGEGSYSVSLVPPSSPEVAAFDQAYEARFGKKPGVLSAYTWSAYDVATALIYCVKQVAFKGDDGNLYVPRGALVSAVRNLKDYKGIGSTLTCSEVGECNATGPVLYVIKDGAYQAVPWE